ncbi:MAG: glycosyltransferase family 39 protein [Deltaproteobacteria bacterium]|nr:glycosyltransferase family 39 protein [Deltaproteobacteria bacterium]MBN2640901.1 glycosyltransferase family 39 protein [Victivallales bacterium]
MGDTTLKFFNKKAVALFALSIIFVIAFSSRIIAVQLLSSEPDKDALQYQQIALNLIDGYGYALEPGVPTTLRPPLYPLFIAGIYALTGKNYCHVLYAQALLHALLVFPVFFLGYRISRQTLVGIFSAGLFAIHTSFEIVSVLYRENIIVILIVLFLWFLYEGFRKPSAMKFIGAGLLSGLLGLTNQVFIPLSIAILLLYLIWPRKQNLLKLIVVHTLISLLIVVTWQVRNHLLPDKGEKKHVTWALEFAYYPAFSGDWWWPVTDMVELEKKRDEARNFLTDHEDNRNIKSRLVKTLAAHPLNTAKLMMSRILILWMSPPVGTSQLKSCCQPLALLAFGLQCLFVMIGLIILVYKLPRQPELFIFAAFALYVTAVYAVTHSIRRYGYPLVPQECIFFSWGISTFYHMIKYRKEQPWNPNI